MKRSEFISLALLSALAVSTGLPNVAPPEPKFRHKKRWSVKFKVSAEVLNDSEAFENIYNDVVSNFKIPHGLELKSKQIGWENDDFTKNIYTVLLTYET